MPRSTSAPRAQKLFDPRQSEPFRLSRSKLDFFLECRRCFYLDRRLGIARPPGFRFNLNLAVDELLKKEFDIHRSKGQAHPLMKAYGIEAVPFDHHNLPLWRDALKGGIKFHHRPTNFILTGAIDDLWVTPKGEVVIVDYKATAKKGAVDIEADWQRAYKRQLEIYQWLFRQNGFRVSPTGYFVYCNGRTDRKAFDGKLEFDVTILPYHGDDRWVPDTLQAVRACLMRSTPPAPSQSCDYCRYRQAAQAVEA